MNKNLLFFYIFVLVFIIYSFIDINLSWDFFLSSIIWNSIWQSIILWIVIFLFGKKYVDELERSSINGNINTK
jgi:hypothetical protein